MRGYKLLNGDMSTYMNRNMILEVGKEYFTDEKIKVHKKGFHFCRSIKDTFMYKRLMKDARLFEVETDGKVLYDDGVYVSNKIKIVREVSLDEVKDYIDDNIRDLLTCHGNYYIKSELIKMGYGLLMYLYDSDWKVRVEIARRKYGLEILVNDPHPLVRREVALAGYGLDQLEKDEDFYVRLAVDMYRNNRI